MNSILEKRLFHVIANRPLATDVFELALEPAAGTTMFSFLAGQWVYLYLLNNDGRECGRAAFSIATAPSHASKGFQLAIKTYGGFTRRAHDLSLGEKVYIQGPFGIFTLRQGDAPLVMFAGGIGVTPLISMIREELARDGRREIVLLYTNRTRADITYECELREMQALHPQFRAIFILTRESPDGWDGATRRIDSEMLRHAIPNLFGAEYLMCGPNAFMNTVQAMLVSLGVNIRANLRKERFS